MRFKSLITIGFISLLSSCSIVDLSSSTSNISSSTLVSWASSLESSNNDSNSFDSSISSSTSDLPISSSSSGISSSSSSSSISSSSSSSISDSSSSTTQGIRPVEDKDDDSRLITTKTLVKLAVPEYVGEVYGIPNSDVVITKGEVYTELNDVAAYIIAFKELPVNYFYKSNKSTCSAKYGSSCRLVGSKQYSNDPYSSHKSPILTDGASEYHECDLASYDGEYSINSRGSYRLVYSLDEGKEIVYFTDCHYENFSEYYNYYNGFGPWWGNGDINQDFDRYPDTISHPVAYDYKAPTIGELDFSVRYPA